METINALLAGFSNAFTPELLLVAFVGVVLGTAVGVLPGLGPVGAIALMLGFTPALGPTASLVLLGAVYYGSMYGGSTTSILLKTPGEATAVATALEGHEMTKRGRGGAALFIAAIASFGAGTASIVGLMLFAPPLGNLAVRLGPPEYFLLTAVGLLVLCLLLGESVAKATVMVSLGLILSFVGVDPLSGEERFGFGVGELREGIEFVPVVMGVFGVAEMLALATGNPTVTDRVSLKLRDLLPTRRELSQTTWPATRGTVVGFVMGLLPGPATVISTFASYTMEKRLFKQRKNFGRGAVAGVAGPEAANNAAAGAAFVPLLVLGIPFAPTMALILSALLLNGIVPGPTFIQDNPELFWTVIASMYIGNVMLLLLNVPFVGIFARIALVPTKYLVPIVLATLVIGVFSVNNSMFDVLVMVISGVLGFLLQRRGYPMAPLALAVVLGPTLEQSWRQALLLGGGSPTIFAQRPGTIVIIAVVALVLAVAATSSLFARRKDASAPTPDSLQERF